MATSSPMRPSVSRGSSSATTDRKASWTPQTRNPVSLRLTKVLSTNFDSEDTREALRTLSELYATAKGKEAQAVVENLEDEYAQENIEVAHTSSAVLLAETVPGESAARARKNLRRDMENQLAEGSRKFLEALGEVDTVSYCPKYCFVSHSCSCEKKLHELQTHVAAMRFSCDEAETQLALTNESSKILLERAGNLRDERFVARQ